MFTAACVAPMALPSASGADAKGCIKGAIVGGVAGHMEPKSGLRFDNYPLAANRSHFPGNPLSS